MKKIVLLAAALALCAALAACQGFSAAVSQPEEAALPQPPALTVASGNASVEAQLGTYSWQHPLSDGTFEGVIADAAHPLDCQELLTPLETEERTASLSFAVEPDAVEGAVCWSDAYWAQPEQAEETAAALSGDTLTLNPGGWIYQVTARWDGDNGGSAHYYFYVVTPEG